MGKHSSLSAADCREGTADEPACGSGETTGDVTVTTPGRLTSNSPSYVLTVADREFIDSRASMRSVRQGNLILAIMLCITTTLAVSAQTVTTLANFDGTNGAYPADVQLIQGPDGNLYGATAAGGVYGFGTIFKLAPNAGLTTLYNFTNGNDSGGPNGLVLDTDGDLYGTTVDAGFGHVWGTAFKITTSGEFTVLHTFLGWPNEGGQANALILGPDGALFGTTYYGGTGNACAHYGCGTVFKMTSSGQVTTLHSFNKTDGKNPGGRLTLGRDGNFYGTTEYGGEGDHGTVFKITPDGKLTTLHSNLFPYGDGVVQATDGNIYGTTFGGAYRAGSVYRVTPSGVFTVLYSFCEQQYPCPDGADPADLIQATDGYLYGTAYYGGPWGQGTIYRFSLAGAYTKLYDFRAEVGGINPASALLQATTGDFYGTTEHHGTESRGTVFGLSMGLGPFVAFVHNPAKAGTHFGILGQGLTGTINVALNGTPVSFTVKSDTLIVARVPTDARSGYVSVTTPAGTLTSNVPFYGIQ